MVADQRGAFCCQGAACGRDLGAAQRATGGMVASDSGWRPAIPKVDEKEELGLLVTLG